MLNPRTSIFEIIWEVSDKQNTIFDGFTKKIYRGGLKVFRWRKLFCMPSIAPWWWSQEHQRRRITHTAIRSPSYCSAICEFTSNSTKMLIGATNHRAFLVFIDNDSKIVEQRQGQHGWNPTRVPLTAASIILKEAWFATAGCFVEMIRVALTLRMQLSNSVAFFEPLVIGINMYQPWPAYPEPLLAFGHWRDLRQSTSLSKLPQMLNSCPRASRPTSTWTYRIGESPLNTGGLHPGFMVGRCPFKVAKGNYKVGLPILRQCGAVCKIMVPEFAKKPHITRNESAIHPHVALYIILYPLTDSIKTLKGSGYI